MRAYQLQGPGQGHLIDLPRPVAGRGEVLLRILRVGLCGSDLSAYRGSSAMVSYPVVPGHELAAEVAGLGTGTRAGLAVGDLVTVVPYFGCGSCPTCLGGRRNACRRNQTLGVQRDGGLCEYLVVPDGHVVAVADDLTVQQAALIEPLSVGFHLVNRSGLAARDRVAVFGCGAVGLGAIAAASHRGAEVTAIDVADAKLAMARRFGAREGINATRVDAVATLTEATGGEGVDVALECAGGRVTFLQALQAVRHGGRMGVVSYSTADVSFNTKLIVAKELDLRGSRNAVKEFDEVQPVLRSGLLPLLDMVTEEVELDQVSATLSRWTADPGAITKVMVRVGERSEGSSNA